MATAMMAMAATPPAAARIRRRRRSLMPARSELSATGPIGGSGTSARSSSARSEVSSMLGVPRLVALFPRAPRRAGFGHDVAQQRPQLAQGAGVLALHVARRAAEHRRRLVHAQV